MYFQDVFLTLERYWGERGCVLLQPHDLMMGAGTFHPATVLRTLGPGAWNCAYTQPSRRPGDARYGDNPMRLGHYYQYQVILKPSPSDVLDLYLGSLAAIGIDLAKHDVRFVEDDWESPTLGAWGLGWEVWLDGMEVSQFTYFQQVGGRTLSPVPAEITYGLERLVMQATGIKNVYQLPFARGRGGRDVTYGDVFHRNEVEQSKYNFEHSDAAGLFDEFNRNFAESERLSGLGLALPAFDRAIMTSHTFNLLNARGAISVAERANYIKRIRELAVKCCEVWEDQVARHDPPAERPAPASVPPAVGAENGTRELFVEVQCEELPARFVAGAVAALRDGVVALLAGVPHGEVRTWATPRRLAVAVADVAPARPTATRLVLGPPADRAMNPDGTPGAGALGFAKGKGVDPAALRVVDGPKGKVVAVEVREGGERTRDLVAAGLDALVRGIAFPKSMEWGFGGVRWGRPIHRVNALYDGVTLPAVVAGLPTGARTVGHRGHPEPFAFASSAEWAAGLRARAVEPDPVAREGIVRQLLQEAETWIGCDPIVDEELLAEVVQLVEAPTLVIGTFDPGLLELPPRLLVTSMKVNQRYFPTFKGGKLHNEFVVISNTPSGDPGTVAAGNAAVLLARFDDARFFLAEDLKEPLRAHGERLVQMRWIRGLGTMAQRQARVGALAGAVRWTHAPGAPERVVHGATLHGAAAVFKADLVTRMVFEFPELQGHVGRIYAEREGLGEDVALAIEEHWRPASAEDAVPRTPVGIALAVADRVDQLVGCFGIGLQPKGNDPQGLRRAAGGLVRILVDNGLRVDLRALFLEGIAAYDRQAPSADFEAWDKGRAKRDAGALADELVAFVVARFAAGAEATADLVDAVVSCSAPDPVVLDRKVKALVALAGRDEFARVLTTFKRVLNISRDHDFPVPDRGALGHDAERALHAAIGEVSLDLAAAAEALDFGRAVERALTLQAPIAALFDAVMVDSPVAAEKAARIGLLNAVSRAFLHIADFSRISTR